LTSLIDFKSCGQHVAKPIYSIMDNDEGELPQDGDR